MQFGGVDKKWTGKGKGIRIPLETLCGYLPGVHFCTPIQKVRGCVGGFSTYAGIATD
jgi:hypothetical protein